MSINSLTDSEIRKSKGFREAAVGLVDNVVPEHMAMAVAREAYEDNQVTNALSMLVKLDLKKNASKQTKKSLSPSAKRFIRDLLIRGEAAKPTPSGDLPPGATHRIAEDDEEGIPTVERERFSLY